MNEIKQTTQNREDGVTRIPFWGTIVMAVLLALLASYFASVLVRQLGSPVTYIGLAVFLLAPVASVISIVLVLNRRQELGSKLGFYATLALGIMSVALFQGRALSASLSILVISITAIQWLFPKEWRRRYYVVTAATVLVMWTLEWINPFWRIEIPAARMGPVAAALFVLILGWMVFTQSRRFVGVSLRNRLLTSVIGLTVFSVGVLAAVNYYNTRTNLTNTAGDGLKSVANSQAAAISNVLIQEAHVLQSFDLSKLVQDRVDEVNAAYDPDEAANLRQIKLLDQQWRAADAANNDNDPLVSAALNSEVASELREFRDTFPENAEVFVTDKYGALVAATGRTSDYYQADEDWWQATYNNGKGAVYFGQPEFDESSQTFGIIMAVPLVEHGTNKVNGVVRTTLKLDPVVAIMETGELGGTGHADVYLPGNQALTLENPDELSPTDPEASARLTQLLTEDYESFTYEENPSLVSVASITSTDPEVQAAIKNLGWVVVIHQDQEAILAPVRKQTVSTLLIALVILGLGAAAAIVLSNTLTGPIVRLTAVAEQIAAGNTVQAKVETKDEIGKLANTFNSMTAQLGELIGSLEQRVADRTRNLELAAEVGRSVSQVRALDVMLKDAAELIRSQFDLYYVQVYLTDASQSNLLLLSGTGKVGEQLVGRGHRLPLNTGSINGRAATEKKSVVITDTTASATFRPNPLLPDTRSEMAVPLIVGDKVVGVLDLQSENANALTRELLPAFEALAGQVAIAIQNANLLADAEQARAEVEAQARRLVRSNWSDYMDAIHKPEATGFVFEQNKVMPLAQATQSEQTQNTENGNSLMAPIAVTGEALGNLIVEMGDQAAVTKGDELVNTVARQVAQHIEELRLLESAERYRAEAEEASRRLTREGWKTYAENAEQSLGYFYDLKEVRPHDGNGDDESALALPLKLRGEVLGTLAIHGLDANDSQAIELVNAVAERLGAHIESLRQFDETRRGQVELDRRAQQLAAVAEVSTASSKELDIQKMLESVVNLTQRKFGLYHAHVFTYNEYTDELQIVACGWHEGDEHEGTHETVSIPLSRERSLVARAARTKQAVIVNDVKSEEGFLPNPLLPDTASEMAVPLIIGDQVLGVLDVQSDRMNAFSQEDANIQTTLASQVSTALQNARSFGRAQQQAQREAMLNAISQKIQSATSVEAVLQIAARELGHALRAPMTVAQLSMKDKS